MVSLVRLIVAATLLGTLWLLAAWVLFAGARRRLSRITPPGPTTPGRRILTALSVAYLLVSIAAVPYAFLVEPYWPEITRVEITSKKLTGGTSIRVVHLSDLHSDPEARLEEELPEIVASLDPHMVVFTGDGVNSDEGIPVFRRCMKRIAKRYPTFVVKGNWEAWWFEDVDVFEDTGAVELDGDAVPLMVDENRVWISGVGVENETLVKETLEKIPADELSIFLHHYPSMAQQLARLGADVHLAGDTHGGQIMLPLLGELVRIHRDGVWESVGLHHKGDMWLYVNRGIGMEGGTAPRVRFGCRPEIALIEIVPNSPD